MKRGLSVTSGSVLAQILILMSIPRFPVRADHRYLLSQSFSSTLIWITAAFFQAKQRVLERTLKKYIFCRKRMERQFWRFDDSRVDLGFCGIRIISVKCLNCLIWSKEFSWIRVREMSFNLAVISELHFVMHLLFHSFYYLLPVPIFTPSGL